MFFPHFSFQCIVFVYTRIADKERDSEADSYTATQRLDEKRIDTRIGRGTDGDLGTCCRRYEVDRQEKRKKIQTNRQTNKQTSDRQKTRVAETQRRRVFVNDREPHQFRFHSVSDKRLTLSPSRHPLAFHGRVHLVDLSSTLVMFTASLSGLP